MIGFNESVNFSQKLLDSEGQEYIQPQLKIETKENKLQNLNRSSEPDNNTDEIIPEKLDTKKEKIRLVCLDVFRGLTMAGMIMVDEQGDEEYAIWPFKHSVWDNWTTADQIFPNFLFIMGIAIPFVIRNPEKQKNDKKLWFKIIKRGILLFLIGCLLNLQGTIPSKITRDQPGYKYKFHFRVTGILQRLGISYIVVSSLYLTIKSLKIQFCIYLSLIIIYMGFMYYFLVPDYDGEICNLRGAIESNPCNFEAYFDYLIFGQSGFGWSHSPTDPEGFWGYLTSVFNTFMGLCCCLIMNKYKNQGQKVLLTKWSLFGLTLGFLGLFYAIWIPLNKALWSVSFMLTTSGISMLSLVLIYLLKDIYNKDWSNFIMKPFIFMGMNPLFTFILMDEITIILNLNIKVSINQSAWVWFYQNAFVSWLQNQYVASTFYAIFWFIILDLVAYVLYKKKIFIKL